jgi:hypothetical protein
MGVNPIRTSETHTTSGNRTTDTNTIQRVGADGKYEPYLDVEKETVKVDATTTRTIQRAYAFTDGQRRLVQTTEEESRTLPGGEVKTVRTTSNPDPNGGSQVVQKEIEDTKKTGPGAQLTTTSVQTPDIDGRLSESFRTVRHETRTGDHNVQFQKTTELKDGSGNWQTGEVRQGVVTEDGKDQTREETVLQPDSDGKLAVVRRDVTKQVEGSSGETKTTTETDSVDLPGVPRDGELHPVQRTTTTKNTSQDGVQSTRPVVRQPNPGAPTEPMQVTVQTTDTVRPSLTGVANTTHTVESFSDNLNSNVIWVDMGRSDKPASVPIDPAPPVKPTASQNSAPAASSKPVTPSVQSQPK